MANAVTIEQVDMWELLCTWSEQAANGFTGFGTVLPVSEIDYLWFTWFREVYKFLPANLPNERFMYLCFLHEMQLTGDL